jgi:ribosomal protein S14
VNWTGDDGANLASQGRSRCVFEGRRRGPRRRFSWLSRPAIRVFADDNKFVQATAELLTFQRGAHNLRPNPAASPSVIPMRRMRHCDHAPVDGNSPRREIKKARPFLAALRKLKERDGILKFERVTS